MSSASAANTASIQYVLSDDELVRPNERTRAKARERRERYVRFIFHLPRSALLSMNKQETQIRVPGLSQWLDRVERRIVNSIAFEERRLEEPGRWLSPDVAEAALGFFRNTADVLPSEPFVYASRLGDLVAEFAGAYGTLTSVVSPHFIILFAQIGEEPIEKRFDPRADLGGDALRGELKRINYMLRTGRHGSMAPAD
jgi:hypothetical protein